MKQLLPLLAAGMLLANPAMAADQLAFPGAAGWGRMAKGARGVAAPTVYHVTNLNDSGTGSLRDAVSQPGRIVVFDVSGVIKISSRIVFASNLYVAGQTAPGEGITVYGDGVSFSGSTNSIIRYLRVRMGHSGSSGKDAAGIANGTNMIFDHCSFSWGLDETFSINPDGKGTTPRNITLMNTIFGQGLLSHSAGGLMQADSITLYRNLYIDNATRNNKVKGINQYANNVVYNWSNGAYIMGGDSEGYSYTNIQSNLFINGPAKGGAAFTGANDKFHCYGDDNWQDSNMDGVYDPQLVTNYSASTRVDTPYDYPELELYKGNELIEKNIPTVGASLPYRDQSDCYMIDELMSYGKQGSLITTEEALPIGTPDSWEWFAGTKPADTDGDGMPDAWEQANGTDPNKADATALAANGYLNIENYINSISASDRNFYLRKPITPSVKTTTTTATISWRNYTEGEDGFEVELQQTDGTWKQVATAPANATSVVVSGLQEGTKYAMRLRAYSNSQGSLAAVMGYSDYATIDVTTRQTEVGVLDPDTYTPSLTLGTDQTAWDATTTAWTEGRAFAAGDKVLLASDADRTLTVSDAPEAGSIMVKGKGDITLEGVIAGDTCSVNKAGTGTLTLSALNTYKGATVANEGTVSFSTLKNGGEASAIGASLAFPGNWVWNGGTYQYTGPSTSTDRSARLLADSRLDIANKAATITASGAFEGDGGLEIDGEGTLAVADAATFFAYKGDTRLSGGTLRLTHLQNAGKVFGNAGHKVVMNGGTLAYPSDGKTGVDIMHPIEVVDGTTSTIVAASHGTMRASVTGSGTLELQLPYLRFNISNNLPNFRGRLVANSTSGAKEVIFYHSSQWNTPHIPYTLRGIVHMTAWSTNATNVIGGLSGEKTAQLIGSSKQTKGFKCSWEVGGANTDETFHGTINNLPAGLKSAYSGTVSIKKVGTGLWRLTGANEYAGTTVVSGGQLIVDGTHTGGGAYAVNDGATLRGTGTINSSVSINAGGTLQPGDTLLRSTRLTVASLSLKSGSTLLIPLYKEGTSRGQNNLKVNGSVKIEEGAILDFDLSNVDQLNDGDYFLVWATVPAAHTGSFTLAPAPEGMEWDDSELFVTGRIYARVSTGIAGVKAEADSADAPTYNLSGQRVPASQKGLVIRSGKKVVK